MDFPRLPDAPRVLERRPELRRLAAVLWAAFLGGVCNLAVMLSLPMAWLEPGNGLGALSLLFFISWAVALVPAFAASVLAREFSSSSGS